MTRFDVPTQSYLLPPGTSAAEALGKLAKLLVKGSGRRGPSLAAVPGPLQVATWSVLDTADRRLRAAGLDLGLESGHGRLVLRDGPGTRLVGDRPGRAQRRYLVADLPAGGLRQRLAPVVGVRALLLVTLVRRRDQPVEVHNRDDKTVVRLLFTDLWADPETDPVRLPGRVEVAGVLGYPKAYDQVDRRLRQLDLRPADTPIVDDALVAVGRDPQPPPTRPTVGLRPQDPAGEATLRVLDQLAEVVEANLPGTLDDLDPEFLHDLRVAVRRSRSVLREMKTVFDPDARRVQAEALRWVQAVTGPTRDLDVQLLEWDRLVAQLPAERHHDVDIAHQVLAERRAAAFRTMRSTLRGAPYRERWASWRDFVATAGPGPGPGLSPAGTGSMQPIRRLAARRVRSVYRRMVRDGRSITAGSPAEALHELRKRGKELRYLLELFGGVLAASKVKPMVTSLKGLQDVLGRHQDREVQADNLRRLGPEVAARPGGADALLALGALVDRLRVEQQEARDQFAERFAAFATLSVPT